jgi:hypothetical protein
MRGPSPVNAVNILNYFWKIGITTLTIQNNRKQVGQLAMVNHEGISISSSK